MLPIRRAGKATCPDCRAAIDPDGTAPARRQPEPDTPESGPGPEELDEARSMLDAHFRDLVENGPYLGFADPDVRDVDAPKVWRPAPDPVTAWRAMRDAVAERGMPPDVMPPEPVRAQTRPDSLLPVVQSVSEPPEREAGRLAFGGLIEGRADPGGQLPLLPAPEGPRVPLLPT